MIQRTIIRKNIETALGRSRVVALIGPRQCGKTTLARGFVDSASINYFDLEDPIDLARLVEPMTALSGLSGAVVIDEIQRMPELFPVLRVLADRDPLPSKFLILGSASPSLMQLSSESLAGRIEILEMTGFNLGELNGEHHQAHWLRGGFPLAYLAGSDDDCAAWRKNFISAVAERDLQMLGSNIPSAAVIRFWTMLAHYHGQVWNAAEPARSLGATEHTVRRYLDLLTDVFMVRQLQPFHVNIKKRQVKSPKVYFRDSGILHQLLGIRDEKGLYTHPKCGASWEGYVLEEALRAVRPDQAYFWATHNGAEMDLLLFKNGRSAGIEFKRADAPKTTKSMKVALQDLALEKIFVIYPGGHSYPLAERIEAVAFGEMIPVLLKYFS